MRVDASMLSNASNIYHNELLRCPHHVPLPESEWIADRDIQIRNQYQVHAYFRWHFRNSILKLEPFF